MTKNDSPPNFSIEAEQSVIGGLILKNDALPDVSKVLSLDDFYDKRHQLLIKAIQSLASQGQPFDPVTLSEQLQKDSTFNAIGGGEYLGLLAGNTPSAANIMAYARIVKEKSFEREFRNIGQLMQSINCSDKPALDKALGKLDYWKSQKAALSSEGYDHLFTEGTDFMKQDFGQTEWLIPGLVPVASSGLLVAKPKVGKTTMSATFALGVNAHSILFGKYQCKQGNVLFVNLDMSPAKFQGLLRRVSLANGITTFHNLSVISELPRFDEGGIAILDSWCKRVSNAALIVISMLKDVKPIADTRASVYDIDSQSTLAVKPLIKKYGVSVIFEHHANKRAADSDVIDLVSGSTGLSGSVDNNIIMTRGSKKGQGIISRVGRDYPDDSDIHFVLERDGGYIREINEIEAQSSERQQIIEAMNDGYCNAKEIADILNKKSNAISNLLYKMLKDGLVEKKGYGKYELTLTAKCGVSGVTSRNSNDDEAYSDTYTGVSESVTAKCGVSGVTSRNSNDDEAYSDTYPGVSESITAKCDVSESVTAKCGVSGVTSRNPNDDEARREFSPQLTSQLTPQVTPVNPGGVSCGVTSKLNNDVGLSGVLEQVTPLTPPFTPPSEINDKDKGQGKTETKGKPLNGKKIDLQKILEPVEYQKVNSLLQIEATTQGDTDGTLYHQLVVDFKAQHDEYGAGAIRILTEKYHLEYPLTDTMRAILKKPLVVKGVRGNWRKIKPNLGDDAAVALGKLVEAGFVTYDGETDTIKVVNQ